MKHIKAFENQTFSDRVPISEGSKKWFEIFKEFQKEIEQNTPKMAYTPGTFLNFLQKNYKVPTKK